MKKNRGALTFIATLAMLTAELQPLAMPIEARAEEPEYAVVSEEEEDSSIPVDGEEETSLSFGEEEVSSLSSDEDEAPSLSSDEDEASSLSFRGSRSEVEESSDESYEEPEEPDEDEPEEAFEAADEEPEDLSEDTVDSDEPEDENEEEVASDGNHEVVAESDHVDGYMDWVFYDDGFLEFTGSGVIDGNKLSDYKSEVTKIKINGVWDPSVNAMTKPTFIRSCKNLKSIDLSEFDSSAITDASSMFNGCASLNEIVFGGKFSTENVTNMSARNRAS